VRTRQRDDDRGWGDEKVRGRRTGYARARKRGGGNEKRNKDRKHRHVNNEREQQFSACRKQITQKAIFSPLDLPCRLRLVSTTFPLI